MRGKEKYLDLWPASLSKTFTLGLRFRSDHIYTVSGYYQSAQELHDQVFTGPKVASTKDPSTGKEEGMKIEVEKEENEEKEEELNMLEKMRSLLVEVRVREEEGAR